MAFAQLRRRFRDQRSAHSGDTAQETKAREIERAELVSGSTRAIARSLDLLARTEALPGMRKFDPRKPRYRS